MNKLDTFKIVKARKEWQCCYCDRKIKIGQLHQVYKTRAPRYSKGDQYGEGPQIGIEYIEYRLCLNTDESCIEEYLVNNNSTYN